VQVQQQVEEKRKQEVKVAKTLHKNRYKGWFDVLTV
jgi:hypothetical protein